MPGTIKYAILYAINRSLKYEQINAINEWKTHPTNSNYPRIGWVNWSFKN